MDITTTTTTTSIKTPEAEAENPIRIQQPVKPLSFTNGVLKRHHHHHSPPAVVTYRECLKNHAASLGGHAVDGCGEFMPSPTASQTDPTSLKCAACGCHRNFHRREPDEPHVAPPGTATAQHIIEYQPHHRHHPPPPPPLPRGHSSSPNSPSPPPISSAYYPSAPHMLLALSHGVSGPPPENNPLASPTASLQNGRKRFRTKFTAEQKEKMQEFAERVGWKMQKKDEEVIGEFCNQVGVDKGVLKVWMHNNKSTLGKRERDGINNGNDNGNGSLDTTTTTTTTATHYHHHDGENNHLNISHHLHNSDDVVITNGSSSSS